MTPLILDKNFEAIGLCDTFKSFIWADRYNKEGDFEIVTVGDKAKEEIYQIGNYIYVTESDRTMIVESLELKTNYDDGDEFIISGRSLDSILSRRIVWGQKDLTGNFQNAIQTLLNENIISPSDPSRKIPNFKFKTSTDSTITSLSIDTQFTGDTLYKAIQGLCDQNNVGFKVTREGSDFVFSLYVGTNRTYDQTDNLYVEFSPKYDNITETDYVQSSKNLKNVTLVGGEGEGSERKYYTVGNTSVTGLDRYELFTDARGTSSKVTDDNGESRDLSTSEYNALLKQKGDENLAKKENMATKSFDGKLNADQMFTLNKDFYLGDVVQVVNEYGIQGVSRITEIIYSWDNNGLRIYPSFDSAKVNDIQTSILSWVDKDGYWHSIDK
ncbi:siphovirus ReqiPepy6 Gp37-like family protein [Lachnoclostridium sp. Marseille-P6806]|uniref:siphovirus ReqiPepy6 Gp37-like family protein n=1 Tax=Lachnoclostridium sp. Marseille-P6806 TaxID=2364793 RepID=UPI001030104F|nr:siphovirus ReqiPepy6 Gp37-like family protein [Lachnoclostridium sp. Marseille-P6806]